MVHFGSRLFEKNKIVSNFPPLIQTYIHNIIISLYLNTYVNNYELIHKCFYCYCCCCNTMISYVNDSLCISILTLKQKREKEKEIVRKNVALVLMLYGIYKYKRILYTVYIYVYKDFMTFFEFYCSYAVCIGAVCHLVVFLLPLFFFKLKMC